MFGAMAMIVQTNQVVEKITTETLNFVYPFPTVQRRPNPDVFHCPWPRKHASLTSLPPSDRNDAEGKMMLTNFLKFEGLALIALVNVLMTH